MKVLFHSSSLGYRGTDVAIYDYALHNEEVLGNESIILTPKMAASSTLEIIQRFTNRFNVVFCESLSDIDRAAARFKADLFYCMKHGSNDGVVSRSVKNCIHAVFMSDEIHGDVYAYISEWLSQKMSAGRLPYVPYIVNRPRSEKNFRDFFAIPHDAIVFGRYGSNDSFDLPFVQDAVIRIAEKRKDVFFLFMNTDPFSGGLSSKELSNIIHVPGTNDLPTKSAFINTCDAMLHARQRGETFGLAVAEFSAHNKPIITYFGSPERAHIDILREKGLYYGDVYELMQILDGFKPDPSINWDCYSTKFSPDNVMKQFSDVFMR
jgi:hypothetical protein